MKSGKSSDQSARKFFISYAHAEAEERALAAWLRDGLIGTGHEVFIDTDIPLGARWAEEIERRIEGCDLFIVLLSANSAKSEMVSEEVRLAREHERRILPLRIKFTGYPGYQLNAILQPLQWIVWESEADSAGALQAILRVAADPSATIEAEQATATAAAPPSDDPFARPEPAASRLPRGSVWIEDRLYLARGADAELSRLSTVSGQTLLIEAPRQMGKSSLLRRYLADCSQAGKRTAYVDLSGLDFDSYGGLLTGIAAELSQELGMDEASPPAISKSQQLTHWVQQRILSPGAEPVALAFDEVDSIFAQDYRQKFFALLRSWHNRRPPANSPWRKLDLALVISTEPHLLIDDLSLSPFNVGNRIRLQPFTAEECQRLNQLHHRLTGRQLDETQVNQLRELLGGQPYLTRLAYHLVLVDQAYGFDDFMRAAETDESPFADHLRALLSRLRKQPDYNLAVAFRQIIQQGQTDDQAAALRLKAAGLVRDEGARAVPANGLYAHFFGRVL
jgi:serine/threonine-protein kinase